MSLAFVVGVGIIAAIFLVIAFKLDEEHGILRFAFIMFAMGLLFLIPANINLDKQVCETVLNSTEEFYVYGNNFTGGGAVHWDNLHSSDAPDYNLTDPDGVFLFNKNISNNYEEHCYNTSTSSEAFVKAVKYPYWLFIAYLVVYLFYRVLLGLGRINEGGSMIKSFKGFKK